MVGDDEGGGVLLVGVDVEVAVEVLSDIEEEEESEEVEVEVEVEEGVEEEIVEERVGIEVGELLEVLAIETVLELEAAVEEVEDESPELKVKEEDEVVTGGVEEAGEEGAWDEVVEAGELEGDDDDGAPLVDVEVELGGVLDGGLDGGTEEMVPFAVLGPDCLLASSTRLVATAAFSLWTASRAALSSE